MELATNFDFSQELAFIEAVKARERQAKARLKRRLTAYRSSLLRNDPDLLLDHTNFEAVEGQMASCLKGWLKQSLTREQLRIEGFDRKVAIAASARWERAMSYVRCSPLYMPGKGLCPCDETHLCPICHNTEVGDPIQWKFSGSFLKSPPRFWYALSFCYAIDSSKAWLQFITKRDSKGRPVKPDMMAFASPAAKVRRLTQEDWQELEACGQVPFEVLRRICRSKKVKIEGALGGLDLYTQFVPVGKASVDHGFFVHVHVLLNRSKPLTWEDAQRISTLFCKVRVKHGVSLFPDLKISLLQTEKDFKAWLRYTLKPMKFEDFYAKGAIECEDRAEAFNDEFDQTVFTGAHLVYGKARLARYYGNMQQRRKDKQAFIGEWQYPPTLSMKDFKRIRDELKRTHPRVTAEEREQFDDHLLYLNQQEEHRRIRKERKQQRQQAKRRGGRRSVPTYDPGTDVGDNARAQGAARLREREGAE